LAKDAIRRWLVQFGNSAPWLARLCLWGFFPFPRIYLFVARYVGLTSLAAKRTWRVPNGPLTGFKLTSLSPDEIGPVLANRMEFRCSNLLAQLSLEGKIVLDIGGSYGYYALLLSRLVGESGQVFSFEPDWNSFERLTRNLAINERTNTRAVPFCLSDLSFGLVRWVSFDNESWNNRMADSLPKTDSQKLTVVPVTTLDDFICALGIDQDKIRLIKIDVEGAELKVMRGAVNTLRNAKPSILCELHGGELVKQVFEFLKELGYQWKMIEYMGETRQHIFAYPAYLADQYEAIVSPFALNNAPT